MRATCPNSSFFLALQYFLMLLQLAQQTVIIMYMKFYVVPCFYKVTEIWHLVCVFLHFTDSVHVMYVYVHSILLLYTTTSNLVVVVVVAVVVIDYSCSILCFLPLNYLGALP